MTVSDNDSREPSGHQMFDVNLLAVVTRGKDSSHTNWTRVINIMTLDLT